MQFSVLMSVYKNTKPDELRDCIDSLLNQTVKADEYIIVKDGPLSDDLNVFLTQLQLTYDNFVFVNLEQNVGLGNALREGMERCAYEVVARMDTDDICVKDRFEKQIKFFEEDEQLSVLGSNVAEFTESIDNVIAYREVPGSHKEICEFLKKRDPFNHMTVMFRKSHVMASGGYLPWHYNEDSYLWARMFLNGAKFANINENLVFARVGKDMYARRGGYKYFKSEKGILKFKKKNRIIGFGTYLFQVVARFIIECVLTNKLRGWLYKKYLRKTPLKKVN